MAFISVTRLRIRSWRFVPLFIVAALRSSRQARRAPGNLNVALLREPKMVFWTLTAWANEASMRSFMMSGAHRRAMPKLLDWCDEAAVAHWVQDSEALPGWKEAHRRLIEDGRPSKVRQPSADHLSRTIPEPNA
jgi:heme-degrading monooxygenase HmoA